MHVTMVMITSCVTMTTDVQEGVSARSRGAVGGVQSFLNYCALSFHGLLAIAAKGNQVI